MQMTTIERVERLLYYLKLHHRETDPVIDSVLDKLLERERHNLLKQRDELRVELDDFEQRYGLASAEFYIKFEHGELGDNIDFIDWSGAWRVYKTVLDSLNLLKAEPSAA
jgi:hypothetical protein